MEALVKSYYFLESVLPIPHQAMCFLSEFSPALVLYSWGGLEDCARTVCPWGRETGEQNAAALRPAGLACVQKAVDLFVPFEISARSLFWEEGPHYCSLVPVSRLEGRSGDSK